MHKLVVSDKNIADLVMTLGRAGLPNVEVVVQKGGDLYEICYRKGGHVCLRLADLTAQGGRYIAQLLFEDGEIAEKGLRGVVKRVYDIISEYAMPQQKPVTSAFKH